MNRKKIAVIFLALFVLFAFWAKRTHYAYSGIGGPAWKIEQMVTTYISECDSFPESQDALIENNLLRIKDDKGSRIFYVRSINYDPERPDDSKSWNKISLKLITALIWTVS